MPYRAPDREDLEKFLKQEDKLEDESITAFSELYQTCLNQNSNNEILLGAILFAREERIPLNFKILSPNNNNQPSDVDILIYIQDFYLFAKKKFSKNLDLMSRLERILKLVVSRNRTTIDSLLTGAPTLQALVASTQLMITEYKKTDGLNSLDINDFEIVDRKKEETPLISQEKIKNKRRKLLISLVECLRDALKELRHDSNHPNKLKLEEEYNAYKGLHFLVFKVIDGEYPKLLRFLIKPEGGWLNNGSKLLKLTLPVLVELHENNYSNQILWLRILDSVKLRIDQDESLSTMRKKYLLSNEWEKVSVQILHSLFESYSAKNEPSYLTQGFKSFGVSSTQWAVASGLNTVVQAGLRFFSASPTPVGVAVQIGIGLSILYNWALSRFGEEIVNETSDILFHKYANSSIENTRAQLPPEVNKDFCRFVNALLQLPTGILSSEELTQLKRLFTDNGRLLTYIEEEKPQARILGTPINFDFSGTEKLPEYEPTALESMRLG